VCVCVFACAQISVILEKALQEGSLVTAVYFDDISVQTGLFKDFSVSACRQ
jgi:hypothetical protein